MDPATITGPMLLGHLLNYALMGALGIQVYIYALSFQRDPFFIKALVYFTTLLDVMQTCFSGHYAWYALAAGWGNPDALRFTPWSLATIPPLAGTIAFMVQLFYAWRIMVLGQHRLPFQLWAGLLALIGLTGFVASWYAGIKSGIVADIFRAAELDTPVTIWLSTSVACDVLLTLTLVFQLFSAQSNIGFKTTQNVVHRTIRLTIETNAVTAAVVVVELVLYLNSSTTTWYFFCGMSIGKLYSNSLLAMLNSRARKNGSESTVVQSLVWSSPGASTNTQSVTGNVSNGIIKNVTTRTHRDVELASFPQSEQDMTFSNNYNYKANNDYYPN